MTGKSRRATFAALPLLLIGLPAVAQDIGEQLYGSWRVVSFNIRRPKGPPNAGAGVGSDKASAIFTRSNDNPRSQIQAPFLE